MDLSEVFSNISSCMLGVSALLGYLLGSIPFGYIAGKTKGIDLTKEGSGSTGTTNVLRMVGEKAAIAVLIGDFAKGVLAPILASLIVKEIWPEQVGAFSAALAISLAAFAALLGHVKSCWIGFKGGKAVACGVGTLFGLDWRVGLLTAIIWAATVYLSEYSSLGALVAVPLSPFVMYLFKSDFLHKNLLASQALADWVFIFYCVLGATYIVFKHKANIGRLIAGTEPKVGKKNQAAAP
jgi:acyl phosphate:glycerol-3-phosphate acyltransferase